MLVMYVLRRYLGGKLYPARPRLNIKFVAMSLGVAEARGFCQSTQEQIIKRNRNFEAGLTEIYRYCT